MWLNCRLSLVARRLYSTYILKALPFFKALDWCNKTLNLLDLDTMHLLLVCLLVKLSVLNWAAPSPHSESPRDLRLSNLTIESYNKATLSFMCLAPLI